ncbi:hypothetical protein [Paracoccus laeviglucosivorans]|uniref:Uncharacterized protein n=1 Tax=Paracoccus laeviglucosivorans TaxID=1197861 RepID=A0A521BEH3_9RHOB|nr:hypothetical protein [Paracoccus laeviglucosivorans]SMO45473.1 hypothetical protein SAMN06265221_102259 [Paracoccus laeviglucosivorans]
MTARPDPTELRMARARVRIMAARAARSQPGLRAEGRVAGRLGSDLAPLDATMDPTAARLALVTDPALAGRVFHAAAAALMAGQIARAITPDAVADLPVPAEYHDFALRHRALALPGAVADYPTLVAQVQAVWAAMLPPPLSGEYDPGIPAPDVRPITMPDRPAQPRRRWGRAPAQVLALAPLPANPDRHAAALNAALAEFLTPEARR